MLLKIIKKTQTQFVKWNLGFLFFDKEIVIL